MPDTSDEAPFDENRSSAAANSDKFDAVESIGSKRVFNVVNVFYIDRLRQRNFAVPPFFKKQLQDVLFEEGKVMQFRCSIGGFPLPEIEWYKGSARIAEATESDENIGDYIGYKYYASTEKNNLFLIVTNVLPEDFGPYTCKIRNIVGEARCTAVLHALQKQERRRPQKDSEGEMQKIVVEETITVVERKPLFADAQSEFYATPSSTTECEGGSDKTKIKQQDRQSEGVQWNEKLMTVMFAVPKTCETRDLRIRTSGRQPGFSMSENNVYLEDGCTDRSSDIDSRQLQHSSRTNVEEIFQLLSPGKELTDAQDLEGNDSPNSEGEMHDREQWIQCGELSDSEYRRNSIPYPLPRSVMESTDDSIQPNSSQSTTDEVTTPTDKNEWRCAWRRTSEVEEDGSEGERKDTVGGECGRLFTSGRSFSSSSMGSGVGTGAIARFVRAIAQNAYFDRLFDKSGGFASFGCSASTEEDFELPSFRGDSEDRSEFIDVFDDELTHSPRTEHRQKTADICDENDVSTLHNFSPMSPDSGGFQGKDFEQDLVSTCQDVSLERKLAECPGIETSHMTASFAVEEFVEPFNAEDQQSEPSPLFLSKSTGLDNDENRESANIAGDNKGASCSSQTSHYYNHEESLKTLDDLIARLLQFSQNEYVMVSSLKVAGRSAKRGNNSDTVKASPANHVTGVDNRAIQPSFLDDMYTEPYNVQQMSIPMHPSDLSAESEDEVEQHQPKFVIPLQDMVVDSEESIVLNVSVTGFPAPQISWFKDDQPLNEADTGEILDDLQYQSATYTCVAKNPSGEAVTSANVTVRTKRDITKTVLKDIAKLLIEYEIFEEVGSGRFGTVHKITHKSSGKNYAAKNIDSTRPSQRKDVELEIELMKELKHEKLVGLVDAFVGQKEMVMVMELITGGELFDRIVDETFELTEDVAATYINQICQGVGFMHSKSILHLDLKPENILCVSPDNLGKIKIIDFGFSRRYTPNKQLKVMFGTPEFVAPEVLNFDPLGPGTDMWSIGVISYVLLSGLSPFMGDDDLETLSNVTGCEWDFEDECFSEISDDAKDFIEKLLAPKESQRPTCNKCLQHLWVSGADIPTKKQLMPRKSLIAAVLHLKKFVSRRKWALFPAFAAAGATGIASAEVVEKYNGVVLRQKTRGVPEEKRWSQIVSASLVDYLRSKAKSLQLAEEDASATDGKQPVTRVSENAVGLIRDDVTLRRGSMLSLNSMSTTSFESADETLTSSDAGWEEVVSTCEEDFMSTDEYIFPGVGQNDLARLRLSGLYVGTKDDDDDLFSARPVTPTPISEKPPFEYAITQTRSSRPFTRTATEPSFIVPGSSEDMETAPSNNVTPVPLSDENSDYMLSEVDLRHPNFLVSLKDSDLVLGCTCALTCCVLGSPEPDVAWYRNGIRILPPGPNGRTSPRSFLTSFPAPESSSSAPSFRFNITSECKQDTLENNQTLRYTAHTLTISDCRLTDVGEYSVTAVNSYGSNTCKVSIGIKKEGETVSEGTVEFSAPRFLTKISDADGMLGGDADMNFELTGQPEPDVTIFHNKEEVDGERHSLTKDDEGRYTLTISDLQLQDEGEVRICAINVIGYAKCSSELFVDERMLTPTPDKFGIIPQWSDHTEDIDFDVLDIREQLASQSIAPYFDDIADDVTTEIGGESTFAVCVYAWPAPDVYWYKDEERVLNAGRFSIECTDFGTHILKIRAINETDAGIYTCVAKNTIGEVSCKAELMLPTGNMSEQPSDDEERKETERRRFKDEYTICGNICSGSFSVVLLVRHNETNAEYVAKYIRCVKVEWREKFLNEVKILKKLSSSEIIAEYKDYFETKKHIILIMKHAGQEWFAYLLDRIDVTELEIASQVGSLCCGLQYLHENKIVHLDVKPENIMITEKSMKIVDFGSAKELKELEDVFWEYGMPEFIPPEIVESRPVTAVSDMWSFGVVVFVALGGITPFSGESDYATIQQVRKGKCEFDNRWFAAVSEEAKDFIRKLLVLEPSSRMTSMEAQSHQWLQDNQSKESANSLSEGRLKYFCSRRKWQRSLVGPKTSLVMRSIPSLLRQEYDSASVAVPRSLIRDYTSSSTVTESEDETDNMTIDSTPTSPVFRFDTPRTFTHTTTLERGRRELKSSITIEDTIELQNDPVGTPTLKVTESSPKSSPVLKRKFVFGTNGDDDELEPDKSKNNDKRLTKPIRLSPIHPVNRLKIIGKKVSFDDDLSNITEVEEVKYTVSVTALEQIPSPPIVSEEVMFKEIPPVAQMPEVSKPATASDPSGIVLDRPQSVSKLLKEDRNFSKPRRTAEASGHISTREKIKKKLSLKNLRRHRSFDTRSLSSSSDDETVSRNGRKSTKEDSSARKPKFSLFTRRKRSVTKGSSIDSSSGQPEEQKTSTGAPEHRSAGVHEQSPTPAKSPIKGILKRGASSDASSQSDPHLPKSLQKSRTSMAANQESFSGPRIFQKRPLVKGMSLDLDMVAEKSDSSYNDPKLSMKSSSGKRRPQFRRGSSVESALPTKPHHRVSGLRGPLLEKGTADDEPTAGMSLRRSTPVANNDVSLPNHSRSYSGTLSLPSPTFGAGRLSPTILSPSSPYRNRASLQRSFFSQSVDIAGSQLPYTVPENDFIGRKSQSAQLPTTGLSLPRSRSQDRPSGRRSRSSERRSPGESYAPYLKVPLVDQGVTKNQTYATLNCLIDAFPQPEITWRKDGVEVNAQDCIEIISEPSISRYQLKIRNLALPADFGHYSCEARNAFGTVKTDCKLMQAISPEKPTVPEFSGTDGRNVWITWNPPGNCATSPMSYMLQYREMAAMKWVIVDDSIKDTLHKVENLRPTTSYRFRVRAVNNAGVGPYSKVSQRIQLDPKATIQTLKYAF